MDRKFTGSKSSLVIAAFLAAGALVAPASVATAPLPNDASTRAAVKRSVSISAPTASTVGRPFAVTGKVKKTPRGKKVKLQVHDGTGWQVLKTTRTKRRGAYSFKVTPSTPGTVSYRVEAGKTKVGRKRLARATSRTIAVRVDPVPVTFVDYALELWAPYGGSGSPAFESGDYTGDQMRAELEVGETAWVSFNLKGQCRTGFIKLYGGGVGGSDNVANFVIKVDGNVISTQALGVATERLVELPPLVGAGQLEVSASATGPDTSWGAVALFNGTLNCVSGTSS